MQILLIGNTKSNSYRDLYNVVIGKGYEVAKFEPSGSKNFYENFKDIQNLVITTDVVIADETSLEDAVQYQLALALENKKPTLLVVQRKSEYLEKLLSISHRLLTTKTFETDEERSQVVSEFAKSNRDKLDAKMFMIIPPNVNKYLEWIMANTEKTKSDVVRSAVGDVAQKDKDYQEFLKSHDLHGETF